MTVDYKDRLLSIYNGAAGIFEELERFDDTNSQKQLHNWESLLTNFEIAVAQGSVMFGNPTIHLLKTDFDAPSLEKRLKTKFEKLTAWNIGQKVIFVIFLFRSSTGHAMKMCAGLIHSN